MLGAMLTKDEVDEFMREADVVRRDTIDSNNNPRVSLGGY